MKRVLSVCLATMLLLVVLVQPVMAQQGPVPQRRWSYLIRTGVSFTIEGDEVEFSASCLGSDAALYTVTIFLMNLDGDLLAGPYFDGPREVPFTGGTYTITESGGYYAIAIFQSVVDGEVAESTMLESSVIYV